MDSRSIMSIIVYYKLTWTTREMLASSCNSATRPGTRGFATDRSNAKPCLWTHSGFCNLRHEWGLSCCRPVWFELSRPPEAPQLDGRLAVSVVSATSAHHDSWVGKTPSPCTRLGFAAPQCCAALPIHPSTLPSQSEEAQVLTIFHHTAQASTDPPRDKCSFGEQTGFWHPQPCPAQFGVAPEPWLSWRWSSNDSTKLGSAQNWKIACGIQMVTLWVKWNVLQTFSMLQVYLSC